jgi:hypothetical protein
MIVAAAFLIAAGHCADRSFCPTVDELRQAVHLWRDEQLWNRMLAMNGPNDDIVLLMERRTLRITDVYCDAPDEANQGRSRARPLSTITRAAII